MVSAKVVVGSKVGLHARPARLLVEAAGKQPVRVLIGRDGGKPVPADSILAVMSLGVGGGEEVVVSADGEGAERALEAITALLAEDLDA
ncbi:HPr family phosphocarrier protein [Amycolatopsis sp. cg5]|uniref:HPr family phosphocarrier protein n=1 Tax=Amycolatopsis sp. cg5 TaxID=3238802 RepID=UPI003524FCF1